MLFILSLNFTDQGIRNIKDGPKRAKAAREMAKKIGVDIKQLYLTSGESDLLVLAETANGDNMAKLALAIGSQGNVRSRTARAWTEEEYAKLVSELPQVRAFRLSLVVPCAMRGHRVAIRICPCPRSFAHAIQAPESAGACLDHRQPSPESELARRSYPARHFVYARRDRHVRAFQRAVKMAGR